MSRSMREAFGDEAPYTCLKVEVAYGGSRVRHGGVVRFSPGWYRAVMLFRNHAVVRVLMTMVTRSPVRSVGTHVLS